ALLLLSASLLYVFVHSRPLTMLLYPYTTLFRSPADRRAPRQGVVQERPRDLRREARPADQLVLQQDRGGHPRVRRPAGRPRVPRSEEHTSELQSRFDLVCRLLLEKKNNND